MFPTKSALIRAVTLVACLAATRAHAINWCEFLLGLNGGGRPRTVSPPLPPRPPASSGASRPLPDTPLVAALSQLKARLDEAARISDGAVPPEMVAAVNKSEDKITDSISRTSAMVLARFEGELRSSVAAISEKLDEADVVHFLAWLSLGFDPAFTHAAIPGALSFDEVFKETERVLQAFHQSHAFYGTMRHFLMQSLAQVGSRPAYRELALTLVYSLGLAPGHISLEEELARLFNASENSVWVDLALTDAINLIKDLPNAAEFSEARAKLEDLLNRRSSQLSRSRVQNVTLEEFRLRYVDFDVASNAAIGDLTQSFPEAKGQPVSTAFLIDRGFGPELVEGQAWGQSAGLYISKPINAFGRLPEPQPVARSSARPALHVLLVQRDQVLAFTAKPLDRVNHYCCGLEPPKRDLPPLVTHPLEAQKIRNP